MSRSPFSYSFVKPERISSRVGIQFSQLDVKSIMGILMHQHPFVQEDGESLAVIQMLPLLGQKPDAGGM